MEKYENIVEVIGDYEYGEKPYEISEIIGNFTRDVIVFGYNEQDALDNYIDHGERVHGWEVDENIEYNPETDNVYFAKGYFPINLDYIHIRKVSDEEMKKILVEKGISKSVEKNELDVSR